MSILLEMLSIFSFFSSTIFSVNKFPQIVSKKSKVKMALALALAVGFSIRMASQR
jgi:hypothetical protein